jgi:hypothetical protein
MTKRNAPLMALMVSLIVLAQLIGGIGCQGGKSESGSPIVAVWEVVYGHVKWLGEQIGYRGGKSSAPLVVTAREVVYANIKWLEEQKFEEPDPLAPLEVNVDSVESTTARIGRDGDVQVSLSGGAGLGAGGVGMSGGMGGIGGGGGGG